MAEREPEGFPIDLGFRCVSKDGKMHGHMAIFGPDEENMEGVINRLWNPQSPKPNWRKTQMPEGYSTITPDFAN